MSPVTVTTRPVTLAAAVSVTGRTPFSTGGNRGSGAPLPTVEELERAWQALREGRFRRTPAADPARPSPLVGCLVGPVVVVAGVHGWSGASTTALLLADAALRRGDPTRVVDTASPVRSGFAAAAESEFGVDQSGRWRLGARGRLRLQRPADPFTGPAGMPQPLPADPRTVTVIDGGWTVHDLLAGFHVGPAGPHSAAEVDAPSDSSRSSLIPWVTAPLLSAPLVLTARATIPGLRHLEHALDALAAYRDPGLPVVVALLGRRPFRASTTRNLRSLPRSLAVNAGPRTTACLKAGLLVVVPERPALAEVGLTPAPLPRELHPAADLLLSLTHPRAAAPAAEQNDPGPGDLSRTRRALQRLTHTASSSTTTRKDPT